MAKQSPMEMLNKIRSKANLDENNFSNQVAIKLNKEGKIRFQLLALSSDNLFMPRTQHFIPKVPNVDDSKQKIIVCNCLGENCPICNASMSFRNSGVTLDEVNDVYTPKYPYRSLRSVFTQPEHFILGAKILLDSPDEGSYLPKDAEIGSTQLIQFSRSALNSLLQAYEDYTDDLNIEDENEMPSLFSIFEDGNKTAKSFIISCRIQTSPYSYAFTFGKVNEISIEEVDTEKLKALSELDRPNEEYLQSAVTRIKDITNYFVTPSYSNSSADNITSTNNSKSKTESDDFNDLNLDDLDTLL